MNLGFKVTKKQAEKRDGHNGTIDPEIQAMIEHAAVRHHKQDSNINMHEARALAYNAFWRQWRKCR